MDKQDLTNALILLEECERCLNEYEEARAPAKLEPIAANAARWQEALETLSTTMNGMPDDNPLGPALLSMVAMYELKVGCAHLYLRAFDDARRHFEQARDTGIASGRPSEVAQAVNNLGLLAFEQGDMTEAARQFRWAINRLDAETEREFGVALRRNLALAEGPSSSDG